MGFSRRTVQVVSALVALAIAAAAAADVVIKSGSSATTATVNSNGSLETVDGRSSRPTYIATSAALVTTAAYNLSVESSSTTGFKVVKICVGATSATAAAGVTVTVQRRTSASSGGVALTAEGTGADSISKLDPADGNYGGIARRTGTLGGAGAVLDQWSFMIGEIGAGTADVHGVPMQCKDYGGSTGEKPITVLSGVTNGLSVNVSSLGTGGLAFGSISMMLVAE